MNDSLATMITTLVRAGEIAFLAGLATGIVLCTIVWIVSVMRRQ